VSHAGTAKREGVEMTSYAVVDPATGERGKEYPTATDDELRAALAGVLGAVGAPG
jgi:hypothetical protein